MAVTEFLGPEGGPGFWEGMIPVWGSGRTAYAHFENGNYASGVIFSLSAVLEISGVVSLVRLAAKGAGAAGARLLAYRTAATAISADDLLRLGNSMGAELADLTLRSRIKDSKYAIRLAEGMSDIAQRDVDSLLTQFAAGNANPGIGNRALGSGFFELRGANGGRVIIKQTSVRQIDIVGKFQAHKKGDAANSAIIDKLIADYNAR